jgi:hypothetical protein
MCRGNCKEKERRMKKLSSVAEICLPRAHDRKIPDPEAFHQREEAAGVKGWLRAALRQEGAEQAWDDLSGTKLDAAKVKEARRNEASYVRKSQLGGRFCQA